MVLPSASKAMGSCGGGGGPPPSQRWTCWIAASEVGCHDTALASSKACQRLPTPSRSSLPRMIFSSSAGPCEDRKSVVEGKSVSVRVDLGGRRIIKKKNNTCQTDHCEPNSQRYD